MTLLILPLGLDTFAVSTTLGLRGLAAEERLRVSLLFSAFETAMPLVGLGVGRGLGTAIGSAADYVAIGVLAAVAIWMLAEDDEAEEERVGRLSHGHGFAIIALGLSISLDEFAVGLGAGLLRLPMWIAVAFIGAQAFVFAQLGMRLGARAGTELREGAERLAAIALLALSVYFLVEKLTS